MRTWILAALIGTVGVALSAGARPWIDAASGAFTPPDITQDIAAAHLFVARVNPYSPEIREMHSRLTGIPVGETFPYFPHPPFSLLVSLFSAYVPLKAARLIWFVASLSLVFMYAALLAENASTRERSGPRGTVVAALFGLLLLWPPILYNLEKGQWSIVLAVLVALGWRGLSRRRPGEGGAWIGAAASVKVFPVLLGGYLLLRTRRGFMAFVAVGLLATCLPLLWIGFDALPAFIRHSQLNMPYWETWPAVTYSLHGVFARLMVGGQWARPAVSAPVVARVLELAVTMWLLWLAIRTTRRSGSESTQAAAFASWVILLPVLNPQSMGHNGVLLALPFVLIGVILVDDRRRWLRVAWALALVLVSIPRQTLFRLAPAPVDPWQGVALIALPMWGALLLLAVAVAAGKPEAEVEARQTG